jgi:hypothetical protein
MTDYQTIRDSIVEILGCPCEACIEEWLQGNNTTIDDMCEMNEEALDNLLEN